MSEWTKNRENCLDAFREYRREILKTGNTQYVWDMEYILIDAISDTEPTNRWLTPKPKPPIYPQPEDCYFPAGKMSNRPEFCS